MSIPVRWGARYGTDDAERDLSDPAQLISNIIVCFPDHGQLVFESGILLLHAIE